MKQMHVINVKMAAITCLLLIVLFQTVSSSVILPVVLLDPVSAIRCRYVSNPLRTMSPESFSELIYNAQRLADSILIFVEEKFSNEDISTKDSQGTPYKHLRKSFMGNKVKYIPNVADPLKSLERLLPPLETTQVHVGDPVTPFDKKFKYHYIYFVDPTWSNETRVETLRRHDDFINEAYNQSQSDHKGPVIVFYTGTRNPMRGVGRDGYQRPPAEPASPADGSIMITPLALIKLTNVVVHTKKSSVSYHHSVVAKSIQPQSFADWRQATRLTYDEFELDFNFEYLSDGWVLDSVVLLEGGEEVGRVNMGVGAPYGTSYYCSEPLVLINTRDKSYVTIAKYQVEPLLVDFDDELVMPMKQAFSNTVNCGTNFNCGILSGLLVTALVGSITIFGVLMMFDCKSNDRVDDHNQKPLVVVAEL